MAEKTKAETIAVLQSQYNLLDESEAAFAEYDNYQRKIKNTQDTSNRVIQGRNYRVERKYEIVKKLLKIMLIVAGILGFLFGIDAAQDIAENKPIFSADYDQTGLIVIASAFGISIVVLIVLLIMAIRYKAKMQVANVKTERDTKEIVGKYDEQATFILLKARVSFETAASLFPDGGVHSDWLDKRVISYIIKHLNNGAADTIKEALVLFKNDSNFAQMQANITNKIDQQTRQIQNFVQNATNAVVNRVAESERYLSWQNSIIIKNQGVINKNLQTINNNICG